MLSCVPSAGATASCLGALSESQVVALSESQIVALSESQVVALSESRVVALSEARGWVSLYAIVLLRSTSLTFLPASWPLCLPPSSPSYALYSGCFPWNGRPHRGQCTGPASGIT